MFGGRAGTHTCCSRRCGSPTSCTARASSPGASAFRRTACPTCGEQNAVADVEADGSDADGSAEAPMARSFTTREWSIRVRTHHAERVVYVHAAFDVETAMFTGPMSWSMLDAPVGVERAHDAVACTGCSTRVSGEVLACRCDSDSRGRTRSRFPDDAFQTAWANGPSSVRPAVPKPVSAAIVQVVGTRHRDTSVA